MLYTNKIIKEVISEIGTPTYIYNLNKIDSNLKKLKKSLPENSEVFYSLKSNPNQKIIEYVVGKGARPEVSSIGELEKVVSSGGSYEKCLYTGPGKSYEELKYIVSKGIGLISIENFDELKEIGKITYQSKRHINLLVRVNPNVNERSGFSISMRGGDSYFGFHESEIIEVFNLIETYEFVSISGFHAFQGSNIQNEQLLLENFRNLIKYFSYLCANLDYQPSILDIGGGFYSSFGKSGQELNLNGLNKTLEEEMKKNFPQSRPTLFFESGRYIVGDSGLLLSEVQTVKNNTIILNVGLNGLGGMKGIGRLPFLEYDVFKLESKSSSKNITGTYKIVGPLCTPMDLIVKNIELPITEKGDILIFPNVGAYGLTASLMGFLSRQIPKEVCILNDKIISIKKYCIDEV